MPPHAAQLSRPAVQFLAFCMKCESTIKVSWQRSEAYSLAHSHADSCGGESTVSMILPPYFRHGLSLRLYAERFGKPAEVIECASP